MLSKKQNGGKTCMQDKMVVTYVRKTKHFRTYVDRKFVVLFDVGKGNHLQNLL